MSASRRARRGTLLEALRAALADLEPGALVERALPPLPPRRARVRVIAAGKAAAAMTRGAFARWGDRIADALVVVAHDPSVAVGTPHAPAAQRTPRTTVHVASHPLPDRRSVKAAEEALRRAHTLGAHDLLLALISGGASSLLAAPPASTSLETKCALVRVLLDSGASIGEVNLVRRHFSRVKGGRLALAAHPARVLTLIVSDVVGGGPEDVGSGPTVADPTTLAEAREVLRRCAPGAAAIGSSESLKPDATPKLRMRHRVVADPDDLARRVAAHLVDAGVAARALPGEDGDVQAIVRRRLTQASLLPAGHAVVIACEPTLALPAQRGRGGRAGHVALAVMRGLPPGITFLAAASDGADGSSGSAGAVVTREDASSLPLEEIDGALAAFDDAPVHARLGTALPGGATGTNLTDVHVLVRG